MFEVVSICFRMPLVDHLYLFPHAVGGSYVRPPGASDMDIARGVPAVLPGRA